MAKHRKSSKTRSKSKSAARKITPAETTARKQFSPVARGEDKKKREAIARLAQPIPKTQIGKLQREIDRSYIEGRDKLSRGKFQEITIPTSAHRAAQFIQLAERDPDAFNKLKNPQDYFGFKIYEHHSRAIFKDVRDMIEMLKFYLQKGSAIRADFSFWRVNDDATWRADRHKTKVSSSKGLKQAKQRFAKRRRKHVETKYKGEPYQG